MKYTRKISVGLTDEQHKLYQELGGADAMRKWLDEILESLCCRRCRKELPASGWFNTEDGVRPYCEKCAEEIPSMNFIVKSPD